MTARKSENTKSAPRPLSSRSRNWITATPIPKSEKSMKKFENTTTIAKTPKSPGVMSRARTAVIKSCIRILEYFDAN